MNTASILLKEKIISISELQKNPSKALEGKIIHIMKNGQEMGIFMSKDEFEDFLEENVSLKKTFKKDLQKIIRKNKKSKKISLETFLN